MDENKKLEFRGSSFMALVPFAIFIVITIALSFFNAADTNMMIGAGVIGLLVGMFFAKNLNDYWDIILEGLGSKVAMTAVMLWLVVGIYGNILNRGQIVEGLVWLSVKTHVSGAAFTVAAFIFAAVFAMATGSGFGTISTMSFILYPAGILLGANPAVLAGAILSGAAVGDNIAPVSDTAIIASSSQEYQNREGVADIGSTVKTRAKFVVIAGVISIILFFIFGGAGEATDAEQAEMLLAQYQNPKGLLLLIPTILVIALAIKGINIFAALGTGIITASVIGLAAGLFPASALFSMKDGVISGAIPEGVAGMTTVSIVLILVVAMGNMLVKSGCMEAIVDWMNNTIIKTPRGAEVAIWVAPFVNAVGKKNNLHPYRRTDILATTICSFPFFLPFGGCVLLLLGGISSMMDTYPFLPKLGGADMMFTTFYSWAIWIVMLIACLTGWGRAFEGENGEYIPAKEMKKNK